MELVSVFYIGKTSVTSSDESTPAPAPSGGVKVEDSDAVRKMEDVKPIEDAKAGSGGGQAATLSAAEPAPPSESAPASASASAIAPTPTTSSTDANAVSTDTAATACAAANASATACAAANAHPDLKRKLTFKEKVSFLNYHSFHPIGSSLSCCPAVLLKCISLPTVLSFLSLIVSTILYSYTPYSFFSFNFYHRWLLVS